ncbi:DUF4910 domain-containing protein [Streptomyces jumonjinensis]|uniref:DUF4910 domain-containing protein n=1 Tax=Streptomyces jumonjinensis TaxID=1945 RepID=UPI0037B903A1
MTAEAQAIDFLMADLWPMYRSITGEGTRETLRRIAREIPLTLYEVPSGTRVLDWVVPDEWNLRRAVLRDPAGKVVADTDVHPLHVVNYSEPVRCQLSLDELKPRLHSLPDLPGAIPYRTTYYHRTWGFSLQHETVDRLEPGMFEAEIDATLEPGALSYGELLVPGTLQDEVLISTHVCHPAMANDNLTGIAAATALARHILPGTRRLSYRFVFVPATIGALTWLHAHRDGVGRVRHGLVLSGLGDPGPLTYKRSRRGDAAVDRVMAHLVRGRGSVLDWHPYGYDERQYGSPGFDLPVGRLSRSVHGTYPEYHTSADDLSFVRAEQVVEAVKTVLELFDVLEAGLVPKSLAPYGEPRLGYRGLYGTMGGMVGHASPEMVHLWVMGLADGEHDVTDIAERSGLPLRTVIAAVRSLEAAGLLTH